MRVAGTLTTVAAIIPNCRTIIATDRGMANADVISHAALAHLARSHRNVLAIDRVTSALNIRANVRGKLCVR